MAPGISQVTAMSEAAISAAQKAPGFTTLYKGLDQARIRDLFDDNGNIARMRTLVSTPPTVFAKMTSSFYFAVDREVAVRYACWAKRRDTCQSAVVIHIAIPNSAIESLPATGDIQKAYWPTEEWKSLVWHCRRTERFSSDLHKFNKATLIIGTISTQPNHVYDRMDSPAEIQEKHVLKKKDGRPAVQYVFRGDEGQGFLEDLCNGTGTRNLVVYSLTTKEFEVWRQVEEDLDNV